MAAIKASVNLFALLDGNDPGDKRLVDFDSQLKDQAGQPKKKPASAAAPGYKPKKEQASGPAKKKPTSAAALTKKKPTSSGFKSEKNSPALAAGYKAPRNNLTPAVAATAASMARAMNKQTMPAPPAPPARSANLTGVLFTYPSARERIFKQRQEEFERRQAKAAENCGGVSGDDGKSAAAGAPPEDKRKGKTHGVRVQGYYYNGIKERPGVAVKEATAPPAVEEPSTASVVKTASLPRPPPSIDDIDQFPSLN